MLHELTLSGQDRFGSFQARGYIVEKEEGTFLWFIKAYDDRE